MPKYNYKKVAVLAELRTKANLSQSRAAKFFGMTHRDSISSWELGFSRPHKRRRSRFILYLLDKLNLRRDYQLFLQVWNDVTVEEWEWEPLSRDELWQYLPDKLNQIAPGKPVVPPFLAPNRPPYDLVGRDDLLHDLKQRLFTGGNLALSAFNGLPGVGKTALAIELANDPEVLNQFKDGVLWARLGRNADVLAELGKWGTALDISPEEMSELTNIESRVEAIHSAIGMRRMLLISDDTWELKAALTFKIGGPYCAHLTTTRFPEIALRFAGNGAVTVHELDEVDGLSLLAKLAPNVVQTEAGEAEELVQAVGSLPLALILMGNYLRVKAHSDQPRRIRTTLDQLHRAEKRLSLEEPQSPIERHPSLPAGAQISLMAVISISDEALDEPSRHTLRTLSIFPPKPNTFSEEAAITVSGESVETLDTLYDYGLLETGGLNRYTLHQTIADYAKIHFTNTTTCERMVNFFVNYVETHKANYEVLDLETNNVLAAFQIAFDRDIQANLVRGVNAFFPFLDARGLYMSAETLLSRAAKVARNSDDTSGLFATLLNLGRISDKRGDYAQAEAFYQEGIDLAYRLEEHEKLIVLLANRGTVALNRGDFEKAEAFYQEGIDLAREVNDQNRIGALLMGLGAVADSRGAFEQAESYYQESLTIARRTGHRELVSVILSNLSGVAAVRGDYTRAESYLLDGLDLARELGHKENISLLLSNLGQVAQSRGDYTAAEKLYREGLDVVREIGHRKRTCLLLANLGTLLVDLEEYAQAEEYLQEGLSLAREIGQRWHTCAILTQQGELHLKQGQLGLAAVAFNEALEIGQEINSKELIADALYGLGRTVQAQGHTVEARRQIQESLTLYEAIGHSKAVDVKKWLDEMSASEG